MFPYKVYVIKQKKRGSERVEQSITTSYYKDVALAGWWAAYHDPQYHDGSYLLLLTRQHEKLKVYRFCSQAGDENYVGPTEEIIL